MIIFTELIFSSCKSNHNQVYETLPPRIYASKNWKAGNEIPNFNNCSAIVRSNDGNMVAIISTSNGLLRSYSNDEGMTWQKAKLIFSSKLKCTPIVLNSNLIGLITTEKNSSGGQLYYYPYSQMKWGEPSTIRDTKWGRFNLPGFEVSKNGMLFCAWTDWRNGNPDVYISTSINNGTTWCENIKVTEDPSGQEQNAAGIISASDGKLYIFWEDNRDSKTLFDIYCSVSANYGLTWSEKVKVNDDTTNTWQISPSYTINSKGNICVVWMDSRDTLLSGGHTSNIYFSRSEDKGRTWQKNIRISSSITGGNLYPRLLKDNYDNLYCCWQTTEDNLLYDIFIAYSTDKGNTWSEPVRINDDLERAHHYGGGIILPKSTEDEIIYWFLDWRVGKPEVYLSRLTNHPDNERKERVQKKVIENKNDTPILKPRKEKILLSDDRSVRQNILWEINSGTWINKNKMYIGYGSCEAKTFAGDISWKNYEFNGKFKLDSIDHRAAYIYIRVQEDMNKKLTYYRLTNFFRQGVTLEYFDGEAYEPILSSDYYFKANKWYAFRTIIKDNLINYIVDDSLLIATSKINKNERGKIGIGAFSSPTYFENISVTSIK